MSTYSAQISSADSLIRRKGCAVTITRPGDSSFDPLTQAATQAPSSATFRAVILTAKRQGAELVVGKLEGRNVALVYLAQKGQTIVPRPGDVMQTPDGVDWKILWSDSLDPARDGPIITTAYAER